ncbi:MAG: flagellar biosynthesis anti-sigma factor FlgM [Desulfovibrio sp.]|uniref:flagellar biosynthesis anti-sigma factor FlgM n=1 Tax=Desulfovibrio sp. 7SRBS1 TaxID=3378064 RepID=UPI003B3CC535
MIIKNLLQGTNPYDTKKIDKSRIQDIAAKGKTAPGADADKINLSEEARLRSVALSEANSSDGMRNERIAELKAKVANGSYQPDLHKTAENLVKQDLELLM